MVGLLPLPFLVGGLADMAFTFGDLVADFTAFILLVVSKIAYPGLPGLLVIQPYRPGHPDPNRFRPARA